ncbi:MAG: hypothetical protein COA58_03445 [Bacteroidetes bacterium]|nr:MAG: hypothetical protein COA58_03445 [Bacteroidota bacterium]
MLFAKVKMKLVTKPYFCLMKKILLLLIFILPLTGLAQKDTSVIIEENNDDVYEFIDVTQNAEFPRGDIGLQNFLATHMNYPAVALENNEQGKVIVMFVVGNQGKIRDARVMNKGSNSESLEKEALRVVKATSGMWTPAMRGNDAVSMRFRIPVEFKIFDDKSKSKSKSESK